MIKRNYDSDLITALQNGSVIVSAGIVRWQQFRFPRSKKRRIRAKWKARRENFRKEPGFFIDLDGRVYMHPAIYAEYKKAMPKETIVGGKPPRKDPTNATQGAPT